MNDVPAIFFEGVVSPFFFKDDLLCSDALAGLSGHVASQAYAKSCVLAMWLRNGRLEKESYLNWEGEPVDIETPNRKHLRYMQFGICAGEEEYSNDPEAMERVLSATKGNHVVLLLQTSNISKETAKCVESIQYVFALKVETKITSNVLKTMRSLVEKNTLNEMEIAKGIEEETAQLLVDLLKQKQFHRMYFPAKCSAALKTIIASWRENSEEMAGKMIYCNEEFSDLQLPSTVSLRPLYSAALKEIIISWREKLREMVGKIIYWRDGSSELKLSTEFPFKECTEDDERDAKRAYPFAAEWPHITTKSVLRNQNGSAVYCFSTSFIEFKSTFVFA